MALSAQRLGAALAAAAGSVDAIGVERWQAIAAAIVSEFTTNASVNPAGVSPMVVTVGSPGVTAVTGAGKIE
jgi:hypothetical protein